MERTNTFDIMSGTTDSDDCIISTTRGSTINYNDTVSAAIASALAVNASDTTTTGNIFFLVPKQEAETAAERIMNLLARYKRCSRTSSNCVQC